MGDLFDRIKVLTDVQILDLLFEFFFLISGFGVYFSFCFQF